MEPNIVKQDIISDEALKAPLELAANFKLTAQEIDAFIARQKEHQKVIGDTRSVKTLTDSVDKLSKEEKNLADIQNKVNDKLKQSDKNLDKLKKTTKDTTEEQKKSAKATSDQSDAMELLDEKTGGFIGRAKELGAELMLLAKSPFILMLTAAVAIITALVSSVKTFFAATGEGEDIAARQTAVWNQFFNTLKKGWSDLGKSVTEAIGEDGSVKIINGLFEASKIVFPFLGGWLTKLQIEFNRTSKEASDLADVLDDIATRSAINIETRARTERDASEIYVKIAERGRESDEERLELTDQYIRLKKQQLQIDLQIAKDTAQATLYQIGLEHSLTKAQVDRMTFAEMDAEFTGEQIEQIMKANAAVLQMETNFNSELRRLAKLRATILEEIRKDAVQDAKDEADQIFTNAKMQLEASIQLIREEVITGNKLKKDGDKEIADLRRMNAAQLIDIQMKALRQVLQLEILNADERAEIEKKLTELKFQYNEALYNQVTDLEEIQFEAGMSRLESLVNITNSTLDSIGQVFAAAHDRRMREIDEQEERLTEYYDRQIEMAGDNTKTKTRLENEYDKKVRDLEVARIKQQRRAAIFEKAVTFIQATANVALAATNQAAKGDPYSAFARVAAILAALAPIVASIVSKDIPQYKHGGIVKTSSIVQVSEEGPELYRTPAGNIGLTPSKVSYMRFPVGTEIIDNKRSLRMLAMSGLKAQDISDRKVISIEQLFNLMMRSNKSLEQTIKNKRETHINITKSGIEKAFANGKSKQYFLDNLYP